MADDFQQPDSRRLRAAPLECRRSDGPPGRPLMAAFTATVTLDLRADTSICALTMTKAR
jgi:hypothetical protein